MHHAPRTDWKIPLALLALSAIPCAAGVARLLSLAHPDTLQGDSQRFLAAPLAVGLHILSASLFCLLGALQFSTGWRWRHPRWHALSGRLVAASGVLAALSGLWLTLQLSIPPALQGGLLRGVRLCVGTAMVLSIVLALLAVLRRDVASHRAWMMRGYALGMGAGTQVVLLMPWTLILGPPSAWQRDLLMSLAWLVNGLLAERFITKRTFNHVPFALSRVLSSPR